jgi:hypothetical protein
VNNDAMAEGMMSVHARTSILTQSGKVNCLSRGLKSVKTSKKHFQNSSFDFQSSYLSNINKKLLTLTQKVKVGSFVISAAFDILNLSERFKLSEH